MSSTIDWEDTIKKEARGVNDEDLGEVQEVTGDYVLVQRGIINKEKFYIPRDQAESYDGDVLRFKITEEEILDKYSGEDGKEVAEEGEEEPSPDTTTARRDDKRLGEDLDVSKDTQGGKLADEAEETMIPLTEEKLEVSKNVLEDQVTITKEPVTETKTVEVPVTREKVEIEVRPARGDGQPSPGKEGMGPVSSRESITIPIKKEEVEVSKNHRVKEEVAIRKKPVTETRAVSEQVTSERINISDVE
jgi:uncharacterized protein (TIGR02271 family)